MRRSEFIKKASQGYVPPNARRACRSCIYGAEIPGRERRTADDPMLCRNAGFTVAPMGICSHYVSTATTRILGD